MTSRRASDTDKKSVKLTEGSPTPATGPESSSSPSEAAAQTSGHARSPTIRDVDVLIVGAGIVGLCAAYEARRLGREPTIVDAGIDMASTVPTALINPVRGYLGKVLPRGAQGARFTFALLRTLVDAGHPIPYGQGLYRPVPDHETRARWSAQLVDQIEHRWTRNLPEGLNLAASVEEALYLPESGWVQTAPLLAALRAESLANVICATALELSDQQARLDNGIRLTARRVVMCGGARGAHYFGARAAYRPGALIVTPSSLSSAAVSYGVYAAPHGAGSVLGSTREPIAKTYPAIVGDARSIETLLERATHLFRQPIEPGSIWRGVRLDSASVDPRFARLTGFGSGGYLLAPLAAHEWAMSELR